MEVLNDVLKYQNLKVYQNSDMFQFSLDSILLANFVTLNQNIKKILDIGTGNAIIPLILTQKTKANITGIEIQKEVFSLAKKTINYNHLESKIQLVHEDINDFYLKIPSETYDVITCNPPYFKINSQSRLNHNKYKTIARHELKLNLDQLMKISSKLLKNNGVISIVHRPERLIEIITIMKKYNIEPKKMRLVYPGKEKEANILLIEGKKNGKSGLKILQPLYSHLENGDYTPEVKEYFG